MTYTIKPILILLLMANTFVLSAQKDIQNFLKKNKIEAQSKYNLYYEIEQKGNSKTPKKGDYVSVKYTGQVLDGKVFDKSAQSEPFVFQVGYGQVIRGLDIGITLFDKGSKGKLYIPADFAYGKTGVGNTIPPNSPLVFEIELIDVMDFEAYDKYMVALEQKERRAFEQHKKDQFKKDMKAINEYAASNKIKAKRTASGLSYAIKKKGKGKLPQAGDYMKVSYEGFLLDGTPLYKSANKKTHELELGAGKVIKGWDEGLAFFNKSAEGWLLVPSSMAYGPRSIEEEGISIPADAVLAFKVKVLEVRAVSQAQTRK